LLCIAAPTASGKTNLAINLKSVFPIEIISVDSVMVYDGFNIGSAKPQKEILKKIPHHLIDIKKPNETYNVGNFLKDSKKLVEKIHNKGSIPLFVGGTMMYFDALFNGLHNLPNGNVEYRKHLDGVIKKEGILRLYKKLKKKDNQYANTISKNDRQRIIRALEIIEETGMPYSQFLESNQKNNLFCNYRVQKIGIYDENREVLHNRIYSRLNEIIENGLVNEVEDLIKRYEISNNHPALRAVNYKQALSYIKGEIKNNEMKEKALYATRQLAKRQMTWMRKWANIEMFEYKKRDYIKNFIKTLLSTL
jgi:tRNA dimethylallyltransferase